MPNAKRDASDIAKRFQELGLKTELVLDAGQDAMRAALDKFTLVARDARFAAFYYADHGAYWDKHTYKQAYSRERLEIVRRTIFAVSPSPQIGDGT